MEKESTEMPKVIILQGLPGSGKSTWAKEQCSLDNRTKRITKDDLRAMLGGDYSKGLENLVKATRDFIIKQAMMLGYETIIIDDTNFHPSHISDITAIVEAKVPANYSVEILEFECPVEICIQRDAQRNGKAHVGAKVIRQMQKMKETYEHISYPNKSVFRAY